VTHKTTPKFWAFHNALPEDIQLAAAKAFALLKADPRHPSLQFKKLSGMQTWSARINDNFRAVAVESDPYFVWIWIGSHDEYKLVIRSKRNI
jgi:hypothetical protein